MLITAKKPPKSQTLMVNKQTQNVLGNDKGCPIDVQKCFFEFKIYPVCQIIAKKLTFITQTQIPASYDLMNRQII